MKPPVLADLCALVRTAAREELLPRHLDIERSIKADGSIVTSADTSMQARLRAELATRFPAYALLGEEMDEEEQRARLASGTEGVWCLDPLDGTSNFAAGLPFFAVSLALLVGTEAVLGIVYDPIRDECFAAERGRGAYLNGEPLRPRRAYRAIGRTIAAVDFKRLSPGLAARLGQDPPYASQRNFGASSLDWCWLAAGRVHLYLHGSQKMWDYMAGHLILQESGGFSCTLGGEAVPSQDLRPRSVVAALDETLFTAWRQWIDHNR